MNILVTGGAGYIGSHTVQHIKQHLHRVWVLDDLSRGNPDWMIGSHAIVGRIHDTDTVIQLLNTHHIEAVIHFAAFAYVAESVEHPMMYDHNNVEGTRCLLQAMCQANHMPFLVFSSTCAIYGNPQYLPIDEAHPTQPVNPYGQSKWMAEQLIREAHQTNGLPYVILRYFNAAGAALDGTRGECHDPEPHLIPSVLKAMQNNTPVTIHGSHHPTPDGTCIRDYIHVDDLAHAHRLALDYLASGQPSDIFNLGTGHGYSVKQVLDACQQITGKQVSVLQGPNRPGDPPELVANAQKANTTFQWQPKYSNLKTLIETAWAWQQRHPPYAKQETL